jgi:hypothetical protein
LLSMVNPMLFFFASCNTLSHSHKNSLAEVARSFVRCPYRGSPFPILHLAPSGIRLLKASDNFIAEAWRYLCGHNIRCYGSHPLFF